MLWYSLPVSAYFQKQRKYRKEDLTNFGLRALVNLERDNRSIRLFVSIDIPLHRYVRESTL